jgi:hypothetical protein
MENADPRLRNLPLVEQEPPGVVAAGQHKGCRTQGPAGHPGEFPARGDAAQFLPVHVDEVRRTADLPREIRRKPLEKEAAAMDLFDAVFADDPTDRSDVAGVAFQVVDVHQPAGLHRQGHPQDRKFALRIEPGGIRIAVRQNDGLALRKVAVEFVVEPCRASQLGREVLGDDQDARHAGMIGKRGGNMPS